MNDPEMVSVPREARSFQGASAGVVTRLLAVLVIGIKFIVRRQRPVGEGGGIYRNTDPHSFPSGHAARAFLIAVIGSALGPAWLGLLLWIWAPLVALDDDEVAALRAGLDAAGLLQQGS